MKITTSAGSNAIVVIPDQIELHDVRGGEQRSVQVEVLNNDPRRAHSVLVALQQQQQQPQQQEQHQHQQHKQPAAEAGHDATQRHHHTWALRGAPPRAVRLAPGMRLTFEVVLVACNGNNVGAADATVNTPTSTLTVRSDAGHRVDVPLRALAPRPRLRLVGVCNGGGGGVAAGAAAAADPAAATAAALDFGHVAAGAPATRALCLTNEGACAACWSATVTDGVPLKVNPPSGRLAPGASARLEATLAAADAAAFMGELRVACRGDGGGGSGGDVIGGVAAAGSSDALKWDPQTGVGCRVTANVVAAACELYSDAGRAAPVKLVDFGDAFCGDALTRTVTLVNTGPAEVSFAINAGPTAEMDSSGGGGGGQGGGGGGGDDAHAAFLRLARTRAQARDRGQHAAVAVEPRAGTVPPLGSTTLTVTFRPPAPRNGAELRQLLLQGQPNGSGGSSSSSTGSSSSGNGSSNGNGAAVIDFTVQVDVAGGGSGAATSGGGAGKALRFAVRGHALPARLAVEGPRELEFGPVACGAWADREVALRNPSLTLALRVRGGARGSPYWCAEPAALTLPPGGSAAVLVRFRPRALGEHRAAVAFTLHGGDGVAAGNAAAAAGDDGAAAAGAVLATELVYVSGCCDDAGPRAHRLPGGIDATPATFVRERRPVDEGLAAERVVSTLRAANAAKAAAMAAGDAATAFIRAGRIAKARAHMTRPEGGDGDVDMGMSLYRGMAPPEPPPLPKSAHEPALWTAAAAAAAAGGGGSSNALAAATTATTSAASSSPSTGGFTLAYRAPPPDAVAAIARHKERPETERERAECAAELAPDELALVVAAPRVVDFGTTSTARAAAAVWVITNNNPRRSIHVALDLAAGGAALSAAGPLAQVVPPGTSAAFPLALRPLEPGPVRERCEFVVNGAHFGPLEIAADVAAVALRLSTTALEFGFGGGGSSDDDADSDNNDGDASPWSDRVERAFTVSNPYAFPVEYAWESSSSEFTVQPAAGTLEARGNATVTVTWAPRWGAASASAAAAAKPSPNSSSSGSKQGKKQASGTSAPPPAAPAAATTEEALVREAALTLRVKGGADAPQRVALSGELPGGALRARERELALGPVAVGEGRTAALRLVNDGGGEAVFKAVPSEGLTITPARGRVPAGGLIELDVRLAPPRAEGPFAGAVEIAVRGAKPLRVPVRAEALLPAVRVLPVPPPTTPADDVAASGTAVAAAPTAQATADEKASARVLAFPPTLVGGSARLPLVLANDAPVPAALLLDLAAHPEFDLQLSRDAWAGAAGYDACPVQAVGPNGEVAALGSKRVSRRASIDARRQNRASAAAAGAGRRFYIRLKPSSTLAMELVHRPTCVGGVSFDLPLSLTFAQPPQQAARASVAGDGAAATAAAAAASADASASAAAAPAALSAVRVEASGVQPPVLLSHAAVDFGPCVIPGSSSSSGSGGGAAARPMAPPPSISRRPSPYAREVCVRNNADAALVVALGPPRGGGGVGGVGDPAAAFTVEPAEPLALAPDEAATVVVRFAPQECRFYEATIPVVITFAGGGEAEQQTATCAAPALSLAVKGAGRLPSLRFEPREVLLPPVPLGVAARATFYSINDGYDSAELRARAPRLVLDSSEAGEGGGSGAAGSAQQQPSLTVELPEGPLIGLARPRLPIVVTFCSPTPLSFRGRVELVDDAGRAFGVPVAAAADNCSLSLRPFMEANAAGGAGGSIMPAWEEAIGPLHLPPGITSYFAAVTCRPLPEDPRSALRAARGGKALLALLEALSGRPIVVKAATAKQQQRARNGSGGGSNGGGGGDDSGKAAQAARAALAAYDAALQRLRADGGLVHAARPELLLAPADFDALAEARAAAAGDDAAEAALEAEWGEVEARFEELSARAWAGVLREAFRLYGLPRAAAAALPAYARGGGASSSSSSGGGGGGGAAAATVQAQQRQQRQRSAGAQSTTPAPAATDSQAAVAAADELASGTSIYSGPEAVLLAWLNAAVKRVFPERTLAAVANFGADLADGVALFSALAAAWPPFARYRSAIVALSAAAAAADAADTDDAAAAREAACLRNAQLVARCVRELELPFAVGAADIARAADRGELLPLALYLFQTLPQLEPLATVDFVCRLGESRAREVELPNPGRRLLSYSARIVPLPTAGGGSGGGAGGDAGGGGGSGEFAIEGPDAVKAEPGRAARVRVRCTPATARPKEALLVLQPRRDGGAPAAVLVFALRCRVRSRAPLRTVEATAPLYAMATFDVLVANPFPADCDFTVEVVPGALDDGGGDDGSGGGAADSAKTAAANRKKGQPDKRQTSAAAAPLSSSSSSSSAAATLPAGVPDAFGVDRARLRLRAGASEKLRGSFLPFLRGVTRAALLLRDAECGEFAYALVGTAQPPPACLEHCALVAADGGQQAVDVPLPFVNPQLEAAARAYAERHPLGRDASQLARLRRGGWGLGGGAQQQQQQPTGAVGQSRTSSAAAAAATAARRQQQPASAAAAAAAATTTAPSSSREQQPSAANEPVAAVEYEVTSSSALVVPASARLCLRNSGTGQQAAAAAAATVSPPLNTLRLLVRPVGCGAYPATVTLTAPSGEARVLAVEVRAEPLGAAYALELECPARQRVTQDIPLFNHHGPPAGAGGAAPLTFKATLVTTAVPGLDGSDAPDGKQQQQQQQRPAVVAQQQAFTGPTEVVVAPGAAAAYPLAFQPSAPGRYAGRLELAVGGAAERITYELAGVAGEPRAEGHVLIECQARGALGGGGGSGGSSGGAASAAAAATTLHRVLVPNLTGLLPLAYTVLSDLDCLEGPRTLECASARGATNYRFAVAPRRSGTFYGTLSFVAPDGKAFCWFALELRVLPPPASGTVRVACAVGQAVAVSVPVSYAAPAGGGASQAAAAPLVFRATYSGAALAGPARVSVPPGGGTFEFFFAPREASEAGEGVVKLVSDVAGEYWWRVQTTATLAAAAE